MKRYAFLILAVVILIFGCAVLFSKVFKEYNVDNTDISMEENSSSEETSDYNEVFLDSEEEISVKYFKITYISEDGDWLNEEETHAEGEYFYLMPAVRQGREFSHYTDQNGKEYKADDTLYTLTEDLTLTPVFK